MLSDAIISMLIISAAGLIGLSLKLCYSSKCKNVKLGCLSIQRDTDHEQAINISMNSPNNV
jgi:hypothetical protein